MEKNKKKLLQLIPGIGSKVIDGNLSSAIRLWKMELKKSGRLAETFNRKFFKKKSVILKEQIAAAKFRESNKKI